VNARANQLAHHLQTLRVPKQLWHCALSALEMIIGLLGTQSRWSYPLDPLIPTERLVFMLQDARASVILTQQHLAERFEAALLVCLDSDWDAIAQQPDENLLSANS